MIGEVRMPIIAKMMAKRLENICSLKMPIRPKIIAIGERIGERKKMPINPIKQPHKP